MSSSEDRIYELLPQSAKTPAPPNTDTARRPRARILKGPLLVPWVLALLTFAFFSLTVLYAFRSTAASRIRIIGSSPSRPTSVLRVLSELVAVLLTATIAGVFERLQHMLVSRKHTG